MDWMLPAKTLSIELSSYCQARCLCCPFEDFPMKNQNMDPSLFKGLIDQGAQHGLEYIDLCLMGDSLLAPQATECFDYVKSKYPEMKLYASTQGMSATPDFVCKYISTLHVSFYGTDKEVYEQVHRGSVCFEKARDNIREILSRPKGQRPYTILTFLVLDQNKHQLDAWLNEWEPIADEVIVWKPHNWAGLYAEDELAEMLSLKRSGQLHSCNRPVGGPLCIWVNGDVTVCCFSWDQSMVIGNVKEQSLEDIFWGDKRKEIIDIHVKNAFDRCCLQCEKCDQLFSREDALVYSNKGRATREQILGEKKTTRFDNYVNS